MPIMRGPSGATNKTFEIPCHGEGTFIVVNTRNEGGCVAYWDGTDQIDLAYGNYFGINRIRIEETGVATLSVSVPDDSYIEFTRVCFIPGDPLASN